MISLPRLLLCIVFALASGAVFAQPQDGPEDDSGISKLPPPRSERLDLYGAGMCHQCEWRPRAKLMAAPEQCGTDANGSAKLAVFECGRNPACDTVCNFVSCDTP